MAVGPGGGIYVSWSSSKPKPEGALFASDLRLSRSLDGGGRIYLSWYTEGATEEPHLLFTVSADGQHVAPPTRLDRSTTSIPDHPPWR